MSILHSLSKLMTPKLLMTVGVPITTVAAVGCIAMGSNAAFISTTNSAANNWTSGVVSLSNDHAVNAAFSANNIVPGYTESHCIVVTSNSTVPTEVELYGKSPNGPASSDLGYNMQFTIQSGTGGNDVAGVNGAPGSCSGFTPDAVNPTLFSDTANVFMTQHVDSLSGLGPIELAPGQTKTYMITASIPASSTSQGTSLSTVFTWSATNK